MKDFFRIKVLSGPLHDQAVLINPAKISFMIPDGEPDFKNEYVLHMADAKSPLHEQLVRLACREKVTGGVL